MDLLAPFTSTLQLDTATPPPEKSPIRTFTRLARAAPLDGNLLLSPCPLSAPPRTTTNTASLSSPSKPAVMRFHRSTPSTPVGAFGGDTHDFLGHVRGCEPQKTAATAVPVRTQFTAHRHVDRDKIDLLSPLHEPPALAISPPHYSTVASASVPAPAPVPSSSSISPSSSLCSPLDSLFLPLSPSPSPSPTSASTSPYKPTFTRISKPRNFHAINTALVMDQSSDNNEHASSSSINKMDGHEPGHLCENSTSTNTSANILSIDTDHGNNHSRRGASFCRASFNPLMTTTPSSTTSSTCPSLTFSRSGSDSSLISPSLSLSSPLDPIELLKEPERVSVTGSAHGRTSSTSSSSSSSSLSSTSSLTSPAMSPPQLSPTITSCSESSSPPRYTLLPSLDYDWWRERDGLAAPPTPSSTLSNSTGSHHLSPYSHQFYSLNSAKKKGSFESLTDEGSLFSDNRNRGRVKEEGDGEDDDVGVEEDYYTNSGVIAPGPAFQTFTRAGGVGTRTGAGAGTGAGTGTRNRTGTRTQAGASSILELEKVNKYAKHGLLLLSGSEEEDEASDHSSEPEEEEDDDGVEDDDEASSSSCSSRSPTRQGFYKVKPKNSFYRARFPAPPPSLTSVHSNNNNNVKSFSKCSAQPPPPTMSSAHYECEPSPQDFLGEADLPYPLPSTLQERQARQRKRAEQLKQLEIREEREAREMNWRRLFRRRGASFSAGISLSSSTTNSSPPAAPTTSRPASMSFMSPRPPMCPSGGSCGPMSPSRGLIKRCPSSPAKKSGGLIDLSLNNAGMNDSSSSNNNNSNNSATTNSRRSKNCVGFDMRRTKVFEYDANAELDKSLSLSSSSSSSSSPPSSGDEEEEIEEDDGKTCAEDYYGLPVQVPNLKCL
ncbi:hypothetical protein BG004_008500 [Podila humilis]|nr:hypothetical protein BG004_008500 [Podila humilis]